MSRRDFVASAGALASPRTGGGGAGLLAAAALLAVRPVAASAQTAAAGDTVVTACLARDTSTTWLKVAARWSADSDAPAGWSNDSLRLALLALGRADQRVRAGPNLADSMESRPYQLRMARTDSSDAAALQGIITRLGWPTRSMLGVAGADAAFLVAQHNTSLHEEALRLMQALPAGQYSPTEFAMLDDRIRVAAGRPQRFGTQLSLAGSGPMSFDSVEDVAHLAERRAAAGLPPLDVYICLLQSMYGRSVKDPRPEPGRAGRAG